MGLISNQNEHEGHRERLRSRFLINPETFSDEDLLELILTFAIPRRDVAPLAHQILEKFGNLENVIFAPVEELRGYAGIGESTIILLKAIETVSMKKKSESYQVGLFDTTPVGINPSNNNEPKERSMRVFANDEIANALALLPKAVSFSTLQQYKDYLEAKLPYNSAETRRRRANYFLDRYFPSGQLNTPLFFFLSHMSGEESLKPVIFYHVLKSEPAAVKIAEELVFPALPTGRLEREQTKEFILSFLPALSTSSLDNMLRAVRNTYGLLGVGTIREDTLKFQLHPGDLEGFLYIFTSEFSFPGVYTYEQLYQSPTHRWLLWDKEWIRKQLFILRDIKIIAKISEIDTVQQFTMDVSQADALRLYYESLDRK